MSKQSQRRLRAKMIRAAAESGEMIRFNASGVEWIKASEGADDKPKKFSMTAYTGGAMRVGYYGSPVVIDLAGLSASAPLPILLNHDTTKLVGHAEEIKVGASDVKLSGVMSGASAECAQVMASAGMGFPWKASVGASPDKMEFVGDGITTKVNGKTFKGPLYVARKATLGEVSFVAMAADGKTSAKVAATAAYTRKESDMKFEEWVQALGFDLATLTDQQKASLQAKFDGEVKAAAAKPPIEGKAAVVTPPTFDLSACILCHQKHVATIEAKAAAYVGKIEDGKLSEIRAAAAQKAAELKSEALNGEKPTAWLEVQLVKAQADAEVAMIRAERPVGPAIHGSRQDVPPEAIQAGLCLAGNLRGVEQQFTPEVIEAGRRYHREMGGGLQGLILGAARDNGYTGAANRIHRGNYDEVMRSAFISASAPSTHTLTTLLSTVGNKFLLEGFSFVEGVWKEISSTRNVSDFKQITSYRMLDDLVFEEIGPAGEIKHGSASQESFTNQAKTYAKMFALTRADIINDDLGAFDSIRERIGVGCGKKLNSVFWTAFLDDATFFNATATTTSGGHANLLTTVLGETGIAAANVLLANQKDSNGHPLGLGTQHLLLTGATLNPTARKWYVSQELRDTTASTKLPTTNIYFNQYRPVQSAYITSTITWYLLPINAGPMAPMEVCFLDGVQAPTIESADADFNTLGVQFRGYFDFGVAAKEWRASVKSTGAG